MSDIHAGRGAQMTVRGATERFLQTVAFEAIGLGLLTPACTAILHTEERQSFLMLITMSAAMMLWSPMHNAVFDWIEWQLARRVASERPHRLRVIHALSHEVSGMVVTAPILMGAGGLGIAQAVVADMGLSAFYAGYAYLFHLVYDQLRPVCAAAAPKYESLEEEE